jgi:CheY-like chemotaxis protein
MNNTKILIVDDELIMRESLSGWLERVEKADPVTF